MQNKPREPGMGKSYLRFLIFGIVVAAIVPVFIQLGIFKVSWMGILGGTVIFAIAAQGLNLLVGYSGLISLGTAGFMGVGAYISAYVTGNLGLPWELGIILAVVVSVLFGLLIGLASLRIEGLYLGIVTLCVSEVLRKCFDELVDITGGFAGKSADNPSLLFGLVKLDRTASYILLVVFLVLSMMLTWNLVHGQLGRALHAMRGSQVAAQAMGVSLLKYRLIAFALATGYAALAGALYVHFINFVYPSTWVLVLSLNILAMVVVGGMRSIYGVFWGAVIVYAVPDLLLKRIPGIGQINGLAYVFSGVLIILVIMFYPGGVVNLGSDFKKLIGKLRNKPAAQAVPAEKGGKEDG